MLRNYLTMSFRSLWKNKGFSLINIMGLAIGLATCLLILFFVIDELSYDKYNARAKDIYRVDADIQFGGSHFDMAMSPDPIGLTLKKDYPEVEAYVRLKRPEDRFLVRKGDQNVAEDNVLFADSSLFNVFTLPMIEGNPSTALTEPNSVVITEAIARKYFNRTDVVGKSLLVNDTSSYEITGVIKNLPPRSHFYNDVFISMASNPDSRMGTWVMNNYQTYIVLKPDSDPKKFEKHFDEIVDKYVLVQVQQMLGITKDQFKQGGNFARYHLFPLTDIHLHSSKVGEIGVNSDIQYVYIFSAAAIFILLIACVNFMNLSTARSANRAKEVGVRKVLGSMRTNLINQFITESVVVAAISMILAVMIVLICLPYFNNLSGKNIDVHFFEMPWLIVSIVGLTLLVGFLAGSYPAFYLSAFRPVKVLKGEVASGFRSSKLRSALVIFQFCVSILLIVSTIVIYSQLRYIRHKDIGFNREQVLVLQNTDKLGNGMKAFRTELKRIKGVEDVTMTKFLPTSGKLSDAPLFRDASFDQKSAISTQLWNVDEHYISTLGMTVVKGRNFSEEMTTDASGVILNEAAAAQLGYKDPLNKFLYIPKDFRAGNSPDNIMTFHIIGIVKNFNYSSLRQKVSPLALFLNASPGTTGIRIKTADIPGLISQVKQAWSRMQPGQPFSYTFMDDDFNRIYNAEQRTGSIFIYFAALAIIVACLGLFGLVTYAAEQRSKEIGVRKILGASVNNIVMMLTSDFVKLVLIALLIAAPLAWWLMAKWLQGFSYRINMSVWFLVFAGVLAIAIAVVTACSQAIKAAIANPVKSLRRE